MPKTAVNLDGDLQSWKRDINASAWCNEANPETEAQTQKQPPKNQFRLSITTPNSGHDLRPS
jgi:hypothetical protein